MVHDLSSSIMEMYILVQASFCEESPKDITGAQLEEMILSKKEDKILQAWRILDLWLYRKGYTKVDNITLYDSTDVTAEDEAMGG